MTWLPQLHLKAGTFRIARTHNDLGQPLRVSALTPPTAATEKNYVIDASWPRVERLWCLAKLNPTNLVTPVRVVYTADSTLYTRTEKPPAGVVLAQPPHVKLVRRNASGNIYNLGDDQSYGEVILTQGILSGVANSRYQVSIVGTTNCTVKQVADFAEQKDFSINYTYVTTRFAFYVMVFRP